MESDESDSDPGQTQDSMTELHEEATAENMDLKDCSVLLNRLSSEHKTSSKDQDEKDDMNRRIPKPASRIPTFHKRPEKTTTTEAAKAKTPEVKERSLPVPTVRFTSSEISITNNGQTTTHIPSPRGLEFLMTATPRPALRPDEGFESVQLKTRTAEEEGDTGVASVLKEHTVTGLMEDEEEESKVRVSSVMVTPACGVGDSGDDGADEVENSEHTEAITDEQPPWEKERTDLEVKEDSGSCSEADSEEDSPASEEESQTQPLKIEPIQAERQANSQREANSEREANSHREANVNEPKASEPPVQILPDRTTQGSSCCSFFLLFFLPSLLLLLGGFTQHVYHYGLPRSVAQLAAHMELHWLEGIGLQTTPCTTECRVTLVESLPEGLYPSSPPPHTIADSWIRLLDRANHSANIAAFYMTLRNMDSDVSDAKGRLVFERLKELVSKGVDLRVAVNGPQTSALDTDELSAAGAEVREVDLGSLTGGIIHTKLLTVDQNHMYLGSANMDWRSLTQVKELGLLVEDCSCLSQDASRIFELYWSVGGANGSLPPYWPNRFSALSSSEHPLHLNLNGVPARVYLSSSPLQISARGRTDDLAAILSVIKDAQKFIYISVMDYLPQSQFTKPRRFWPPIDSSLRAAACLRGVQVRILVSCWPHSPAAMFVYLQSLLVLNRPPLNCDIQVKVFTVPSTPEQMKIPFARVNHAKFMVTDQVAYIGTSNWSEDYFTQTAGVGLVVNQTGLNPGPGLETVQDQVQRVFLRDWTSQYASDLSVNETDYCPL